MLHGMLPLPLNGIHNLSCVLDTPDIMNSQYCASVAVILAKNASQACSSCAIVSLGGNGLASNHADETFSTRAKKNGIILHQRSQLPTVLQQFQVAIEVLCKSNARV